MSDINEQVKNTIALKFAPTWKRIVSYVIDFIILTVLMAVFTYMLFRNEVDYFKDEFMTAYTSAQTENDRAEISANFIESWTLLYDENAGILIFVHFSLEIIYFTLFWVGTGQTMGNRILRIAIIDVSTRKIKFTQGLFRSGLLILAEFLSYIPLIFLVNPLFKQRIHDFITRTVAIEVPKDMGGFYQHSAQDESTETD